LPRGLSLETNTVSSNKLIPRILQKQGSFNATFPALIQTNVTHILASYFFVFLLNIIIASISTSTKNRILFRLTEYILQEAHIFYNRATCPVYITLFDLSLDVEHEVTHYVIFLFIKRGRVNALQERNTEKPVL
jgi:hypothetical protein